MNYYDWMESQLTCKQCGWRGQGNQAAQGEMYREGSEHSCPQCSSDFGYVMFPTRDEVRTDPRADPLHRQMTELVAIRWERYERAKLVSPSQLPDLSPVPETLIWECVDVSGNECDVVILMGDQQIWRETCWYENFRRFGEIASILKKKYGPTLVDLVPTRRSWVDLYGDSISSPSYIDRVRAALARSEAR